MAEEYILPSDPSVKSLDPLSLSESDNPSTWDVITSCVSTFRSQSGTILQLPNLIEDLVYSIHQKGNTDVQFLRQFLASCYPDPSSNTAQNTLNEILEHALALPTLFSTHRIRHLTESHPVITLTTQQIKCLVAHQMLGTLTRPVGNNWGSTFLSWYSEPQPLHVAVEGYLTTLFHFFSCSYPASHSIIYQYSTTDTLELDPGVFSWQTCDALLFDHLIIEPTSEKSVEFPHKTVKCMLVASNKSPGFGASCTQEELITGACPELLPFGALLLSPPLPDNAALIAQNIKPLTTWRGKGRNAQVVEYRNIDEEQCIFLLLDALELDLKDLLAPMPDLILQNLLRELQKVYTGFHALRAANITDIASPLWGAGAFGGDPIVKAIILGMVGARTGLKVWLSVDVVQSFQDGDASKSSTSTVLDVLTALKRDHASMSVGEMWGCLTTDDAKGCLNGANFEKLLSGAMSK